MIQLSSEIKQYVKLSSSSSIQLLIPCSLKVNSFIGTLISDNGTAMATLQWEAKTNRQLYLMSISTPTETESLAYSGHGYSNSRSFSFVQPDDRQILEIGGNAPIAFTNGQINTIDPAYNCYYNGEYMIIDRCTITDSKFENLVTFNARIEFDGDQENGNNLVMLSSDAVS